MRFKCDLLEAVCTLKWTQFIVSCELLQQKVLLSQYLMLLRV